MNVEAQFNLPEVPKQTPATKQRLGQVIGSQSVRFGSVDEATAGLAKSLFQAPERWGWEYVEPAAPMPYPYMDQYPQWVEPISSDLTELKRRLGIAKDDLPQRMARKQKAVVCFLALLGLILMARSQIIVGWVFLLIGFGIGGNALYEVREPQLRMRRALREDVRWRAEMHANYLEVKSRWDERIRQHDAAERDRFEAEPLLFPLAPAASASRINVFGGITSGWASLLATMGSSTLACGSTVLVLDLTGQDVAAPLARLSRQAGVPVQTATVPAQLEQPWLLGALPPHELADVLAAAMDSMRASNASVDLTAMDAELLHTVAKRLDRPLTFQRLAAGIRVLRSTYEPDEDTVLSGVEVQRLTKRVDLVDRSERMRDEMGFVEAQLKILGDSERRAGDTAATDAVSLWPRRGLGVVRSDESDRRPRDSSIGCCSKPSSTT